MRVSKEYIKGLTDAELKREWKNRGYKEYHSKIGKVAGLGWDTMDACINYSNYKDEMIERGLI